MREQPHQRSQSLVVMYGENLLQLLSKKRGKIAFKLRLFNHRVQ